MMGKDRAPVGSQFPAGARIFQISFYFEGEGVSSEP